MKEKVLDINGSYTLCSRAPEERGKEECIHISNLSPNFLYTCIQEGKIDEIDRPLMPVDDNILLADKQKIESIHSAAESEGVACTYAQTEDIVNGCASPLPSKDTRIIEALNNALEFTLDKKNLEKDVDLNYILTIHDFLYLSGSVEITNPERYKNWRDDSVAIGGTDWRPTPFDVEAFATQLADLKTKRPLRRALSVFELIARTQPFKDCNKRTAMLVANHELIKNGRGLLLITKEFDARYKELLVKFYETNDAAQLEQFLLANCWLHDSSGLALSKELNSPSRNA